MMCAIIEAYFPDDALVTLSQGTGIGEVNATRGAPVQILAEDGEACATYAADIHWLLVAKA